MDYTQHRLYKKISDPIRFAGLTLDEWGVGGVCLSGGFFSSSNFWKLSLFIMAPVAVMALKKFKKIGAGGNLKAFLYWHGLSSKPFESFPDFHQRTWLS